MEITLRVGAVHGDRRPGRIEIRADDEGLTPYAGLAITGQLVPALRLLPLLDAELSQVRRAAPVKLRERGLSAGELLVSLAECQLVGGECFSDVEDLRADLAGASLRAVSAAPSAATALQLAKRFRRSHVQAAERALSRAAEALERALERAAGEPVTIDLDATGIEVFGRRKGGAARSRHGCVSYAPHVAFWAERGRPLASELVGGNREKLTGKEAARIARRALALLPRGHGQATFRVDSAYYALELLRELRARSARFTVSLPRTDAIWRTLERIPEGDWRPAKQMDGAEVAETSYTPEGWQAEPLRLVVRRVRFTRAQLRSQSSRRRRTIHPEQLQLCLDGKLGHCYGYSFILTDIPADQRPAEAVEHFHRHRAQIEERLKEASSVRRCGACPPARSTPTASGFRPRCWRSPSPRCAATYVPRQQPPARRPSARRCAGRPRRSGGCSSASPPGSCGRAGARSCAWPPASATPTSSAPPTRPPTRCGRPEAGGRRSP